MRKLIGTIVVLVLASNLVFAAEEEAGKITRERVKLNEGVQTRAQVKEQARENTKLKALDLDRAEVQEKLQQRDRIRLQDKKAVMTKDKLQEQKKIQLKDGKKSSLKNRIRNMFNKGKSRSSGKTVKGK